MTNAEKRLIIFKSTINKHLTFTSTTMSFTQSCPFTGIPKIVNRGKAKVPNISYIEGMHDEAEPFPPDVNI